MKMQFLQNIRSYLKKIPYSLIVISFFTLFLGLTLLSILSHVHDKHWGINQIKYSLCSIFIAFFLCFINVRVLYRYSYLFFIFCILLLVVVHLYGKSVMGAKRWIEIFGRYRYQPSEIAKIGLVLFLARYFTNFNVLEAIAYFKAYKKNSLPRILFFIRLIFPIIVVCVSALLIASNPDLGTAIIFCLIAFMIFFLVGYSRLFFVSIFTVVVFLCPFLWRFLKIYQKKRLLIFLYPDYDLQGAGYNLLQSKIAIGSGGFFGKGLFKGTQSHLNFLPEYQTDFIFSYFAEEFGFLGSFALVFLYFLFIAVLYNIAVKIRSMFQKIVILGFASLIFIHCFINIAMVTGFMPIVGVPLPFLSYGGSMESALIIGLGLCFNVYINRKVRFNDIY